MGLLQPGDGGVRCSAFAGYAVILSRWPGDGACFVELDDAVRAVEWERVRAHATHGSDLARTIVFNANTVRAPEGSIIFNTDLIGIHAKAERWIGHEVWDFCERNITMYPASVPVHYVPVGYHPSMVRFERAPVKDIDVILCGTMNFARDVVMGGFKKAGLKVVHNELFFGKKRDAMLARSKLAVNMLFYRDGVYPTVRAAHCVANRVPMLNETAPEMPAWAGESVDYSLLVEAGIEMLRHPEYLEAEAAQLLAKFQQTPLVLPA